MQPLKLLIADQDDHWRKILVKYLRSYISVSSIEFGESRDIILKLAKEKLPDIVILDSSQTWDNNHGLLVAYEILTKIKTKLIILSSSPEPELIRDAFAIGVTDYLVKEDYHQLPRVILNSLNKRTALHVLRKDYQRLRREAVLRKLTDSEIQVLTLIKESMSTTKIAKTLCKENSTVKSQIRSIFIKLNVDSRKEALMLINSNEISSKYKNYR